MPPASRSHRPRPTIPRGVGPAFRVALSRPQGPVIEWASRNASASVVTGNPVKGTFGPQLSWPLVPIHAVLLPDGRVLSYGSDRNGLQTGYYDYDIWDPALGVDSTAHTTLANRSGTDLFCNTQTLLLDGNVEMFGGDNIPANTQTFNNHVDLFRTSDSSVNRTGTMKRKRWYASSTVLPNGEILLQGGSGGKDFPEVRALNGTFRLLTGASTNTLYSGYPHNFVAPDGKVFGISVRDMYRINPAGTGTITDLGDYPMNNVGPMSTPAMFAPGKILQVGGHDGRQTSIIDISGATPTVTATPKVARPRKWSTATVMADGRVFVSGGSAENNTATNVSYTSEIFNPATNTWSDGATAQRMRLYHSTSLLLRDGTVLTMGGGVPGPETNLNAEIYYPSYLFASDGSLAPAADDRRRDDGRRARRNAADLDSGRRLDLEGEPRQDGLGHPLRGHGHAVHEAAVLRGWIVSCRPVARQSLPHAAGPLHGVHLRPGGCAVARPGRQDRPSRQLSPAAGPASPCR